MTEAQANQLAKSPATKKALAVIEKFAIAEANYKDLEAQKKEAEATLIEAMSAHDVTKLSGDWGYITLATRKSFKWVGDGEISDEYAKKALDTKKVAAHVTLTGDLPKNIEQNETKYLTKKINI